MNFRLNESQDYLLQYLFKCQKSVNIDNTHNKKLQEYLSDLTLQT